MSMQLYHSPYSGNSSRAVAVARAVGAPITFIEVDLAKGEQRSPAFLAWNPNGLVPVLVDGETTLWESNAILVYLAERCPTPLWPEGAARRADILKWMFWGASHLQRDTDVLLFERLIKSFFQLGPADEARIAANEPSLRKHLAILDGQLARTPFVCGDAPTLADYSLQTPIETAASTGAPLDAFPAVGRWLAAMRATSPRG